MIKEIKRAAVLGSGVMGSAIAAHLASAGLEVELLDIVPPGLSEEDRKNPAKRNQFAATGLEKTAKLKQPVFMSKDAVSRVRPGNFEDHMERIQDCDWIIEVVVEDLKIKREVFKRVQKHWNGQALVSTNTSGIPINAISAELKPELQKNFLGTHFFNPVRFMHLLEIIPGPKTDKKALAFMARFCEEELGKGIVWAKDTPNFVANRVGVAGMIYAMKAMLEMGVKIEEADEILGPPMGRPKSAMFRTADLVGLDTLVHIARNTAPLVKKDEAEKFFTLPAFIEQMVEKKLLGNKTEAGFYKRTDKKKFQVIDPQTLDYRDQSGEKFEVLGLLAFEPDPGKRVKGLLQAGGRASEFAWKVFAGTSIYAAERIPEIADNVVEVDNAMRWGFNFDLGPFAAWDAVGLKESIARMKAEGFKVPKKIEDMLKAKKQSFYKTVQGKVSYYDFKKKTYVPLPANPNLLLLKSLKDQNKVVAKCPTASLIDLGDGVFCVEFHSTMNALDEDMMKMMNTGMERAEAEGVGLVIGNQTNALPGAFSAGANINVVLQGARAGQFAEIERVVKYFQDVNQRLKYSKAPVVSTPHGLTLGGGAEVCMGSNQMVAAADLYMGMVEVGVGLIPGGGGCMNLLKQHQNSIPKQVALDNLQPFVVPVFEMIAMAKTSNSAQEAREMGLLRPGDRIVFNRDHQIAAAKREVLGMHLAGFKPPEREKVQVMGDSLRGAVDVVLFNLRQGNYASDYDVFIAKKLAWVLGGGDVREGTFLDEEELLILEREVFVALCHEEKTQKRLEHMLMTGRPLRN